MSSSSPANLYVPVLQRAATRPDDPAFWIYEADGASTVTHRGLVDAARRYYGVLRRLGTQPGDIVIILLDHGPDQYFAFLGALLAGAVPSFMPPLTSKQIPALYWSSHERLFARIKPKVLVTSTARAAQLREYLRLDGLAVVTPDIAAGTPIETAEPAPVDLGDVAFLQHSSGTTALKKGVQLTHRAVLQQVAAYAEMLGISGADRIASWLPLYHDMGLIACFVTPLVLGIPVAALDPFVWAIRPDSLLRAIEEHRCTLAWMPNFAFHHLVRTRPADSRFDLRGMRAWIDCSEPCKAETFDLFAAAFADCGVTPEQLHVCYAMAETVFAVSQTRLGKSARRLRVDPAILGSRGEVASPRPDGPEIELLSTGNVIDGLRIKILGDNREVLPPGRVGEIAIEGSFLFAGYHRLQQETARKFLGERYLTSDLGFLWEDELYVLGRADDLIIVNGRNFFCHEVEQVVGGLPGLKPGRNVLFSIDLDQGGTCGAVLACELASPEAGTSPLKRRIRERVLSECDLALHHILFVPPGWIVKTTSGKLSRVENRAKYLSETAPA